MSDINRQAADAAAETSAAASTAGTAFHALAAEMAEMSRQSLERATSTIEKLRAAGGINEVFAIQSQYLREAFDHGARNSRRFAELMASLPLEMGKSYAQTLSKVVAAAGEQAEEAGAKAAANVENLTQQIRNS